MSCIDSFQKSLDFIEQNLTHEITLSQCADSAGYSPFHYCRAFQMLTGISVMDYIRKRRLSKAAIELLDSGKSIRQVAFDWGFNSHENFVRAFGKEYGISPSAYRKSGYSLALFRRINLKQKDIGKLYSGKRIEPKFLWIESFLVAGPSIKTTWQDGRHLKDIPVFWNRYYSERVWESISCKEKEPYRTDYGVGFDYGIYGESFGWNGSFEWLGGVKVDSLENLPAGITGKLIPEAEYAVFTTPTSNAENFIENLKLTWTYIALMWLPDSGYKHTGTHELTMYCPERDAFSKDIYIPVSKI